MYPDRARTPFVAALLTTFALLLASSPLPAAMPRAVIVEAGRIDRTNSLVSFPLPTPPGAGAWQLRARGRAPIPLQFDDGRAWYIEPGLARETRRRYRLEPVRRPATTSRVQVRRDEDRVRLELDGRPVATFIAGPGQLPRPDIRPEFRRGGYLHPLVTPEGRVVTDDYPTNHIHHHGVWFSWTRTSFEGRAPDFWNMGEKKGRTDFAALHGAFEGAAFAGFRSEQRYTDLLAPTPREALKEWWTVRVPAIGGTGRFHVIDLESEQRCATESTLKLPKYIYGGLAYRGPAAWDGPANARYLDSNGVTDRVAGNESRVRWHWLGGNVNGRLAGVASLGHPANFRAPQPVRMHPQEPYNCWSPSQAGDWEIRPGETYRSRYRLVLIDGEPDPALLDWLWADYAEPAVARVE